MESIINRGDSETVGSCWAATKHEQCVLWILWLAHGSALELQLAGQVLGVNEMGQVLEHAAVKYLKAAVDLALGHAPPLRGGRPCRESWPAVPVLP